MDVGRADRGYVRCGGTGGARLVRTRLAPISVPARSHNKRKQSADRLRHARRSSSAGVQQTKVRGSGVRALAH